MPDLESRYVRNLKLIKDKDDSDSDEDSKEDSPD